MSGRAVQKYFTVHLGYQGTKYHSTLLNACFCKIVYYVRALKVEKDYYTNGKPSLQAQSMNCKHAQRGRVAGEERDQM